MKRSRKRVYLAAIVLGIGGMGGAFAYHNLSHGEHRDLPKYAPEFAINGTELVVKACRIATEQTRSTDASFTGTLQPRYHSPVGFRVSGKIAARHVEVGDKVAKGDLLFTLDPADYELSLKVAEADLVSANSTLTQASAEEERLQKLRATDSVSLSDYDAGLANRDVARARLESANKRLELAQNQLAYCELRADSDGLVMSTSGEAGQVVSAGQTVVQLMQGTELEAVVNLPETRLSEIRSLSPELSLWSHPETRIPAELRELSPIADPLSRTFDARFRPLEMPRDVAIGMTVTVFLKAHSSEGISVPTAALGNRMDRSVVWRIDESSGGVTPVYVDVVRIENETSIVEGPLHPGDLIVSAGVQRIDDYVKVRVWNPSNY